MNDFLRKLHDDDAAMPATVQDSPPHDALITSKQRALSVVGWPKQRATR